MKGEKIYIYIKKYKFLQLVPPVLHICVCKGKNASFLPINYSAFPSTKLGALF